MLIRPTSEKLSSWLQSTKSFLSPVDIANKLHVYSFPLPSDNENRFEQFQSLLTQSIESTFMISEQRLLEINDAPLIYDGKPLEIGGEPVMTQKVSVAVAGVPEKLNGHFSAASNHYAETDGKLNASFPTRILNQSDTDRLPEAEFGKLYQDMNAKLQALQENGLSDVAQQDIPAFQADKAGILRIFFDDFNEKYKLYEPLVQKLTLFRKILDRRFHTFKRVEISRKYGLRVFDIPSNKNGKEVEISLDKLSSGEQETLVLYYQLIFETAPGTMLLIDEPEISLHIAWQRTFIDELKEIVRLNQLRAVVATHSVSILNGNWDIEVSLGELYKNGREK